MIAALYILTAIAYAVAVPAADFIVVGAGTAGCTVAAQLCKLLPSATITLVERGPTRSSNDRLMSEAAALTVESWYYPNLTTNLVSEPVRGLGRRRVLIGTGANYGGGSAINGGQLFLPPLGTIDAWGIKGLTDARAEALYWRLRAALKGTGVPPPGLRPKFTSRWKGASIRAGLPYEQTPLRSPRNSSVTFDTRLSFDAQGKRQDACRTFLRPARASTCSGRVRVLRGMRAERVLFEPDGVAQSVILTNVDDGSKKKVVARREVLVASGAIESAALLLRSGVGPKDDIENSTRQFVADLPVGKNLRARPVVIASSRYRGALADVNNPARTGSPKAIEKFRAGRGGVLAKSDSGPVARISDVGYAFLLVGQFPDLIGKRVVSSVCVVDVSKRWSGEVRLARVEKGTVDAGTAPVVDLKNAVRRNLGRATECMDWMRRIHKQLNPLINGTEVFGKGQTAQTLETEEGLGDKVEAEALVAPHFVGTCAVGKVVDSQLRVRGLKGLRVVDSAAVPLLPKTAGPMASVYVVAMHAAEMIAAEHADLA